MGGDGECDVVLSVLQSSLMTNPILDPYIFVEFAFTAILSSLSRPQTHHFTELRGFGHETTFYASRRGGVLFQRAGFCFALKSLIVALIEDRGCCMHATFA